MAAQGRSRKETNRRLRRHRRRTTTCRRRARRLPLPCSLFINVQPSCSRRHRRRHQIASPPSPPIIPPPRARFHLQPVHGPASYRHHFPQPLSSLPLPLTHSTPKIYTLPLRASTLPPTIFLFQSRFPFSRNLSSSLRVRSRFTPQPNAARLSEFCRTLRLPFHQFPSPSPIQARRPATLVCLQLPQNLRPPPLPALSDEHLSSPPANLPCDYCCNLRPDFRPERPHLHPVPPNHNSSPTFVSTRAIPHDALSFLPHPTPCSVDNAGPSPPLLTAFFSPFCEFHYPPKSGNVKLRKPLLPRPGCSTSSPIHFWTPLRPARPSLFFPFPLPLNSESRVDSYRIPTRSTARAALPPSPATGRPLACASPAVQ